MLAVDFALNHSVSAFITCMYRSRNCLKTSVAFELSYTVGSIEHANLTNQSRVGVFSMVRFEWFEACTNRI